MRLQHLQMTVLCHSDQQQLQLLWQQEPMGKITLQLGATQLNIDHVTSAVLLVP